MSSRIKEQVYYIHDTVNKKKGYKRKLVFCSSIILAACSILAPIKLFAQSTEWSYDGRTGPDHWVDLEFEDCGGSNQSPVDINICEEEGNHELPEIEFEYEHTPLLILNNGHTIEVEYEEGSKIIIEEEEFELLQFHFHSPSEHTLKGANFPMEMHLVHRNEEGELAVIGVFIKEGKRQNKNFKNVWDFLPPVAGQEREVNMVINVDEMLPEERGYFAYKGSLTTPPCSEGVEWMLLKEPVSLSRRQIRKFKIALRLSCCEQNNRPTQPLNGREIEATGEESEEGHEGEEGNEGTEE